MNALGSVLMVEKIIIVKQEMDSIVGLFVVNSMFRDQLFRGPFFRRPKGEKG